MENINLNEIGPFHVCITCLTSESNEIINCQTSGNIIGSVIPYEMHGEKCFKHKNVVATTYCVLCGRPICNDCIVK